MMQMPERALSDPQRVAFEYEILRKPRLKHLYLRITDGRLVVTAHPRISEKTISDFVLKKSSWIQKHLRQSARLPRLTDDDATIYLLGRAYPVVCSVDASLKNAYMECENNRCLFYLTQTPTHALLVKLRDAYYRTRCPEVITPLLLKYADIMQLKPNRISYRHNKSRWGSCSAKNSISLNTRLMMLPEHLIAYILIHELAHIRHKNHSKAFWHTVAQYCPAYQSHRREIRTFEPLF